MSPNACRIAVNLDKFCRCDEEGHRLAGAPMDDHLYLSAEGAAEALGVSVATVYTYVSGGLIRSQKVAGTKSRRYWRTDVMKIAGGGEPAPATPRLQSHLVETTAITLITAGGHFYRGRSAL